MIPHEEGASGAWLIEGTAVYRLKEVEGRGRHNWSAPGVRAMENDTLIQVAGSDAEGVAARIHIALSTSAPASGAERMTAGEDLPKLSAEARQGVWIVEEMKNHGTSASDQFMSYGIECGGHTILDTLNSGGGVLEQEPADDDIGPFIWDEQAKRDLTFVAALVNAYRSGDVVLASTTPAPATPPGVPDSVRALSEAADYAAERYAENVDADDLTQDEWYRLKLQAREARRQFENASADFVRSLLATHPAGQSAGSGAVERSVEHALQGGATTSARHNKPAPDSTRTGDEGTEWVLVPTRMDVGMIAAFWHWKNTGSDTPGEFGDDRSDAAAYRAMIAARPAAPEMGCLGPASAPSTKEG